MLLQLQNVSKSFGSSQVLRSISFQINTGEKIALIGPNGAGKTTLLRVLGGAEEADSGKVVRRVRLRIEMLDQIPDFHEGTSILEEGLRAFDELRQAERELQHLEVLISERPGIDLMDRYARLQHEFEQHGGYSYRARAEAALRGVGFSRQTLSRRSNALSGGEKSRLALAKLLLSNADVLLLDEPTNHLDIQAIEWLENFLKDTQTTLVLVSHDRFFLDRVASRTLELQAGTIEDYRGNYTIYLRERGSRAARQQNEWELQQEWIKKTEEFVRRNIAGQNTRQAQSRQKWLARVKRIEKPRAKSPAVHFRFTPSDRGGRHVLVAREVDVGYPGVPLVARLNLDVQRGERWAILGPNGSGKTTLLRTLIGSLVPMAGEMEWDERLEVGYYDQQLHELDPQALVLDEIRTLDTSATDGELRTYLSQFLFTGEDVFKRVEQLSGGEKSRLVLAKIIYVQPHLLALDEPANHLDIAAREALETALRGFPGTILFVTHDRYLVEKIATHLIYLHHGRPLVFDRFSVFEQWLSASLEPATPQTMRPAPPVKKTVAGLSKNKRDRLLREVAGLEIQIESVERELAEIEAAFQNPRPEIDWESLDRRYSDLKESREVLYNALGGRWDAIESE